MTNATCIYCGYTVKHGPRAGISTQDAHQMLIDHDQQCPKSPLVAKLDRAEQRADREATGFRAMCEAFQRLEEIVGLDTGGGMGPGPALNAVERIVRERDELSRDYDIEHYHRLAIERSEQALAAPNRDMIAFMHRQIDFSTRAFGPGDRWEGVVDHIRKELREIEAAPHDLEEWIDVVLLGLDGAWRAGYRAEKVVAALADKLEKNEKRSWPDWQTADRNKAIEHNRLAEGADGQDA